MWIWNGTPGHEPPNSEAGKAALISKAPCAETCLGEPLRWHHPEREAGIDELGRQAIGGESTAFSKGVEAELLGVANALVEGRERLAVVEVGGVNDVSGSSQLVSEREESGCLSLCVVKFAVSRPSRIHSSQGRPETQSGCRAPSGLAAQHTCVACLCPLSQAASEALSDRLVLAAHWRATRLLFRLEST